MRQDGERPAEPPITGSSAGRTASGGRPSEPRVVGVSGGHAAPAAGGDGRVIAVYPGSFDPVHRGHLDIAARAAKLVDELVIAIYKTPSKNLMFSSDERIALWREELAAAGLTNVRVEGFEGLIVDFARSVGAQAIIRGLRAVTDFEYEFQQALMNRKLAPEIETLMIITSLSHLFISSSLLKEVGRLGANLDGIVTPNVARAIRAKLQGEKTE
ncbi:MAG TPA: pantetheine-phosphate adenylyltransferase [Ktedonobacterales bacterium]